MKAEEAKAESCQNPYQYLLLRAKYPSDLKSLNTISLPQRVILTSCEFITIRAVGFPPILSR